MPSKGSAGAAEGRGQQQQQQQQQQQPSEKATSNATKSNAAANAAAAAIAERTKVVIRKCPPELPETIFWNSVQPHLDEATIDWKLFKQGRARKERLDKEDVESVAYIHFKSQEAVTRFAQAYQGHVFRSKQGQQSQVIVEYAPFQKIPLKKQKPDAAAGTIDEDADYQAFVTSLNDPEANKVITPEAPAPKVVNKITPLLEELRRQKQLALDKKASRKVGDKASEKETKRTRAERRAAKAAGASPATASDKAKPPEVPKGPRQKVEGISAPIVAAPGKGGKKGKAVATDRSAQAIPTVAANGQDTQAAKTKLAKGKASKSSAKVEETAKKILLAPNRPAATATSSTATVAATTPVQAGAAATSKSPVGAKSSGSIISLGGTGGFDDMVKQFASKMTTKPANPAAHPTTTPINAAPANGSVPVPSTGQRGGRGGRGGSRGGSAGRGRGTDSAAQNPATTAATVLAPGQAEPAMPTGPAAQRGGRGGRGGAPGPGRGRGGPRGRGAGASTPAAANPAG